MHKLLCCASAPVAANAEAPGGVQQDAVLAQKFNIPEPQAQSVQVIVRVRPMISREKANTPVVDVTGPQTLRMLDDPSGASKVSQAERTFAFDRVLPIASTQQDAYLAAAGGVLAKWLAGYNGTIFAYGQTGSGKTFTMEGSASTASDETSGSAGMADSAGIIPRLCTDLFAHLTRNSNSSGGKAATKDSFTIAAQYVEIYQERIADLLLAGGASTAGPSSSGGDESSGPNIRERPDGGVYVEGCVTRPVRSVTDIAALLKEGQSRRTRGETNMNAASSRSHAVLTLELVQRTKVAGKSASRAGTSSPTGDNEEEEDAGPALVRTSKLHLIDLAGSERAEATGATGARLKEGAAINKSLSALGGVIAALTESGRKHVPYRDSKLTRLLQDSLGGNSVTCMICCVSPAAVNYDETLASLRFAERAKRVKNVARVNVDAAAARLAALAAENRMLSSRVHLLEAALVRRGVDLATLEKEAAEAGDTGALTGGQDQPKKKKGFCTIM